MSNYNLEQVKVGKRLYGAFVTFDDGRKVYMAYRKNREIFRGGRKSISEAMRDGTATWAIDDMTIIEARIRGCIAIVVKVKDTGDLYGTKFTNFLDKKKFRTLSYSARGGTLQRHLPLKYWKIKRATPKL